MGVIQFFAKKIAKRAVQRVESWSSNSELFQKLLFKQLIARGSNTRFGRDHNFGRINSYSDFKKYVPVADYESLRPYIDLIKAGEKDVLWPGRPVYFAQTSGTTSGAKYIPVTKESIGCQVSATRLALLNYIGSTGKSEFINGKYIFLSGSPELETEKGIYTGRLSGIVNHHIPGYLKRNQFPTWEVNCIPDWKLKLDAIVKQTIDQKMTLISGIPPWVEMYFEQLLDKSGKSTIKELFPFFSLFVYGGVNFEPYQQKFEMLTGGSIDRLETFPASEGFMAFQNSFPGDGMVLIPDGGIFFEFISVESFSRGEMDRITLNEVEPGINYVLILNTNAGLWGYNLGDTVRFISVKPYILTVTGRVKQYISAFGEHVIAEEAETAISRACKTTGAAITEFTVAPLINRSGKKSCHQWLIDFETPPENLELFKQELDKEMRNLNKYYNDLIMGGIIGHLEVLLLHSGTFALYLRSKGKLGGQNKVPHVQNDREFADGLIEVSVM